MKDCSHKKWKFKKAAFEIVDDDDGSVPKRWIPSWINCLAATTPNITPHGNMKTKIARSVLPAKEYYVASSFTSFMYITDMAEQRHSATLGCSMWSLPPIHGLSLSGSESNRIHSGYSEDLPCLKDKPEHKYNYEVERKKSPSLRNIIISLKSGMDGMYSYTSATAED